MGFLFTNGFIDSVSDVVSISHTESSNSVSVTLKRTGFPTPSRLIITTGFGGGPVFSADLPVGRLESGLRMAPEKLIGLMTEMKDRAILYKESGGIHATALCSCDSVIYINEDVGRQNSMDKVLGRGLTAGMSLSDKAILTTGRISFEMAAKAQRAGITVLASLSSPTTRAVELASRCAITIAGYVTRDGFIAYSHEQRFCW